MMYIYKTTNLIDGKFYVGKSKYHPDENPNYYGSGKILKRAITKYGVDKFEKEILEECDNIDILNEREKYWIKELKANHRDIGYNISSGGDWGDTFTHHPRKEEIREKMKRSSKGKKNSNYGNKWSDDQKKIASNRCRKNNPAFDINTGLYNSQTPEAKEKISKGKIGSKNPNACKWILENPQGENHTIYGGIKRKIKRFGTDYQQFHIKDKNDVNVQYNLHGWTLTRIPKNNKK